MPTIETYEEFILDGLTEYSVSVLTKTYADINGQKTQIGDNRREGYFNCPTCRQRVVDELPENMAAAILTAWGPEATIPDPTSPYIDSEEPSEPSEEEPSEEPTEEEPDNGVGEDSDEEESEDEPEDDSEESNPE